MGSIDVPATHKGERSVGSLGSTTLAFGSKRSSLGLLTGRQSSRATSNGSTSMASSRGSQTSLGSSNLIRQEVEVCFVDPLDMKYECPVCCEVLRYPVQFEECGHRCCSSCLPELLRVAPRCPIDQSLVERDKVYVDKAYQNEINQLKVKCSHHDRGCKWQSTFEYLTEHLESCNYTLVVCPQKCDIEFEKRFLSKHLKNDCPNTEHKCDFCQSKIKKKEEMEHLQQCQDFPVPCPNGCRKKDIPRGQLNEHMENDCSKQEIECPFAQAGCSHKCLRKELSRHIRENPEDHLNYIGEAMVNFKSLLQVQKDMLAEHAEKIKKATTRVDSLEKLYGAQLVWKIEQYAEKLADAKSGKKTTIYSPPFLTSRHGYKMAMSLSLYGDGKARGKYMSLFVCICKGEYDALLLWPFGHRVTFTLVDQCQDPAARRNIVYTVKPNMCKENKPFLGRPVGERNASFGAQKFVDLEILNTLDYIRDDTMYIKVSIDTEDMLLL